MRKTFSTIATAICACVSTALCQQLPLVPPAFLAENDTSTGNFIFNSLAGLLKQLPNSVHPNGHAIVPAVVQARTRLYHAFPAGRDEPCRTEWLAFDPEMSYGIMGNFPINITMWTYVSNRDLRVLYFDGVSAQLGPSGVLDSQEVFLARKGGVFVGKGWWDDYARLHALCEWGRDKGIDGFVRMNTAFELMWCDFHEGLDLISKLNVTPPDTINQHMGSLPGTMNCAQGLRSTTSEDSLLPWYHQLSNLMAEPPEPPPEAIRRSPLALASRFEWLRAAIRRHRSPQPGVKLIPSGMVSFYAPDLTSLSPSREGLGMYLHRLWNNISDSDAASVVDRVEQVLRRDDLWTEEGVQWPSIVDQIVENWSDRIEQLNFTLYNPRLNASAVVRDVQLLAYTLLNPYLDTSVLPHMRSSDPALWLPPTLERCIGSHSHFIAHEQLTDEERLLKASVETVLGRLCRYAGHILAQSLTWYKEEDLVSAWIRDTAILMTWLDWPTWVRCHPECGPEAVCAVSAWPFFVAPVDENQRPVPRCVSFEQFTQPWPGWV